MGRLLPRRRQRAAGGLHVDTGMNRLGLAVAEALALRDDARLGDFDAGAADEPSRQRRGCPAIRSTRVRSRPSRRVARGPSRHPASLANSSGHLPAAAAASTTSCGRATRSTAATRRPDAAQPHAAGRAARGAHHPDPRRSRTARRVGYNGHWTARGRRRLATSRSATRTAIPAPPSAHGREARGGVRRRGDRGRPALPLRRPRLDGPDHRRRDRRADGAVGRGDPVTLIGDDLARRRGRAPRRHHRLRDPDRPRAGATPAAIVGTSSA